MVQYARTYTPPSRRCSRCKERKALSEFFPKRRKENELQAQCKTCCAKRLSSWKRQHRQHYTELEKARYYRLQEEAGQHTDVRVFLPGLRLLQALENAEVVRI